MQWPHSANVHIFWSRPAEGAVVLWTFCVWVWVSRTNCFEEMAYNLACSCIQRTYISCWPILGWIFASFNLNVLRQPYTVLHQCSQAWHNLCFKGFQNFVKSNPLIPWIIRHMRNRQEAMTRFDGFMIPFAPIWFILTSILCHFQYTFDTWHYGLTDVEIMRGIFFLGMWLLSIYGQLVGAWGNSSYNWFYGHTQERSALVQVVAWPLIRNKPLP